MNEPIWLDKETVLEIHRDVVAMSGGSDGLRDEGLLESALARPQNVLAYEEATIFDLAAAYAEAIAHNHPFIDGNKRTAMTVADIFLEINGYDVRADQQQIADLMVDLAEKKISRDDVAAFFAKSCKRI
jgi:death on curing protein